MSYVLIIKPPLYQAVEKLRYFSYYQLGYSVAFPSMGLTGNITFPYGLKRLTFSKVFIFSFIITSFNFQFYQRAGFGKAKQILIPLSGRLGNQLFQSSFAVYGKYNLFSDATVIFLKNNYSAETDLSQSLLKYVRYISKAQSFCSTSRNGPVPVFEEERYVCSHLERELFEEDCIVIRGLWQCSMYADEGKSFISNSASASHLKEIAVRKVQKYRMESKEKLVVTVHIRRGDYTKRFNKGLLEPLPISYYIESIDILPKGAIYLLFSDDPQWCKKQISNNLLPQRKYEIIAEKDQVLSFLMMAEADLFIIANSTYSWWAAFLGRSKRKIVLAPRKWFGPRVEKFNISRFYPASWILK